MIRLIGMEDLVSMLETTLDSDTIAADGSFRLKTSSGGVRYGFIDIGMQRAEIYLVPGGETVVELTYQEVEQRSFYDRQPLAVKVLSEGMNRDTRNLNEYYNHFILDHFEEIYRGRKTFLVDTLEARLERMFPDPPNEYFRNYLRYKIATAEQFAGKRSRKALAEKYLLDRPILYDNVEYNYFFNEIFEKYLLTGSKAVNVAVIMEMLDKGLPADAFIDRIVNDPLLKDPALAEYFLLGSLKELYYNPDFEHEDILRVLTELEQGSRWPQHRKIASNIAEKVLRLAKGTPAPRFTLLSTAGREISLEDLRGKYVYLFFFRSDDPVSTHEMELLYEEMKDYGPDLAVVGISVDRNRDKLQQGTAVKNDDFILLHYGGDVELLEDYDAATVPLFLLLDKEGRILKYPAPWPGENAGELLRGL